MDGSVSGGYTPDRRTRWSRPLSTFYIRVSGDSMVGAGILPGALLVVDRAVEEHDGHIVVARIDDELCVKRLPMNDAGRIWLLSENELYQPIEITEGMDFKVWGHSILGH